MEQTVTVLLPEDVALALDEATRQEGISPNELIGRALKQYLFLRQFRVLRDRLVQKAQSEGIQADQDIFDRVS
jgi:metal-responsive CopG/Arc/MetJ family transcriptional regulator